MNRRYQLNLLPVLSAALIFIVFLSQCRETEQKKKVVEIAIVSGFEAFDAIAFGFKEKMLEAGYVEGDNVVYHSVRIDRDPDIVSSFQEKIVAKKVDLVFAYPTRASLWAKKQLEGSDIPLLFAIAGIEGNDLVESVHNPGGNLTGIRYPGPDLTVKRFELLHELAPHVKRVWTIYDTAYPTNQVAIDRLRRAAATSDMTIVETIVSSQEEIRKAVEQRSTKEDIGIDGIVMMPDLVTQTAESWEIISRFAWENKLPIAGAEGNLFDANTVLSYTPDIRLAGRQAVPMAIQILNGRPAGSIMVVTPQSRLRLNYKLANELGLTIPEGMLSRAAEIIR